VELDPRQLGTLELDGMWVPYIDLHDETFMPTHIAVGNDEYAFNSSQIIRGHGATLPGKIRELRDSGKKSIIAERGNRYYVFVTPP
jgi:hypothetical protein